MSLQDLAASAEIANAVAVVVTLVFLIFSIRQNTQAQRVLAVESLASAITAINVPAMESQELGNALAIVMRDWNAATREQRIIAHYFLFSFFKLKETAWYQHKARTLDDAQWAGWEALLLLYYHSPGIQKEWWPKRRHAFSHEFRDYLAKAQKPPEAASLASLFDAAPSTPSGSSPCS